MEPSKKELPLEKLLPLEVATVDCLEREHPKEELPQEEVLPVFDVWQLGVAHPHPS
jgi:hypothetical protein